MQNKEKSMKKLFALFFLIIHPILSLEPHINTQESNTALLQYIEQQQYKKAEKLVPQTDKQILKQALYKIEQKNQSSEKLLTQNTSSLQYCGISFYLFFKNNPSYTQRKELADIIKKSIEQQ